MDSLGSFRSLCPLSVEELWGPALAWWVGKAASPGNFLELEEGPYRLGVVDLTSGCSFPLSPGNPWKKPLGDHFWLDYFPFYLQALVWAPRGSMI